VFELPETQKEKGCWLTNGFHCHLRFKITGFCRFYGFEKPFSRGQQGATGREARLIYGRGAPGFEATNCCV
jgi:hypothetical protein